MKTDKIRDYWKNVPKNDAEKAFSRAMTVIFVIEFAAVLAVFLLIARYDHTWAVTFLLLMYGFSLKTNVNMVEQHIHDSVMKRAYGEENEEDDSKPAKDIDSSKNAAS